MPERPSVDERSVTVDERRTTNVIDLRGMNVPDLREELSAVEAELDALGSRPSGFDLGFETRRVHELVRSMFGRGGTNGFESEALNGHELVERMQDLQRRRAEIKTRLEALDALD